MRELLAIAIMLGACSKSALTVEGDTIPTPLTSERPDASRGAVIFAERDRAHCILCHQHKRVEAEFQGNLGPDLTELSKRLSKAQIRLRIVDYDIVKPGTTMPSYHRTQNLYQVDPAYEGQTVLSALEIEDIIAFLVYDENDSQN